VPVGRLSIELRNHAGFAYLEEHVLPDERTSYETLAMMIEDAKLVGRLRRLSKAGQSRRFTAWCAGAGRT